MEKTPVLFDCDPGVDDAFALSLLGSCPQFDLRAITAVFGNMPLAKTAVNALGLARALDLSCPVAKGADRPLFKAYDRGDDYVSPVHGSTGIGDIVLPTGGRAFDEREACDVIYDEAVKAGGKLVVFAIGPLTNIARAVMRYPDLPQLIAGFYIMGGGIGMGNQSKYAEANIFKDPTAARICFEKLHTYMVGLNATHAAALTAEDFDEMLAICGDRPRAQLLRQLLLFSRHNAFDCGSDSNIIHDALTIAWAIDPAVCQGHEWYVYTEDGAYSENDGETVADPEGKLGRAPNTTVAMDTDNRRFKDMMVQMCRYYADL
ncbi:Pyrimidine-specific ribonucleoside hydrolase rihA [Anaerotruncus sp. 2789STDY5834896]|uniref:Pyrimidine-specific ribonucleoside hydrolase rihA n=1 Tax=uncultured Anaerotruncus sp. TaxID=905011 RepID=A0A1C6K5V4_9FIRM|nr:Pyrimidine-specific ribonucleoside hydrolase rihA [uncultured Anaerotruncus sp.]